MTILDVLSHLKDEAPFEIFDGQFAYWRGFSGRRYVHTVYEPSVLDDLCGGVAILTDRSGDVLHVLLVGEGACRFAQEVGAVSAHVHFPRGESALTVGSDLRAALGARIAAL